MYHLFVIKALKFLSSSFKKMSILLSSSTITMLSTSVVTLELPGVLAGLKSASRAEGPGILLKGCGQHIWGNLRVWPDRQRAHAECQITLSSCQGPREISPGKRCLSRSSSVLKDLDGNMSLNGPVISLISLDCMWLHRNTFSSILNFSLFQVK